MNESSYTAWDDNLYEWPPPDGWYEASDAKWWPDGYGPGVPTSANNPQPDMVEPVEPERPREQPEEAQPDEAQPEEAQPEEAQSEEAQSEEARAVAEDPAPTAVFPAGGDLDSLLGSPVEAGAEHRRPVYDELPPIDDVFGAADPPAIDEASAAVEELAPTSAPEMPAVEMPDVEMPDVEMEAADSARDEVFEADSDPGVDVHLPPLDVPFENERIEFRTEVDPEEFITLEPDEEPVWSAAASAGQVTGHEFEFDNDLPGADLPDDNEIGVGRDEMFVAPDAPFINNPDPAGVRGQNLFDGTGVVQQPLAAVGASEAGAGGFPGPDDHAMLGTEDPPFVNEGVQGFDAGSRRLGVAEPRRTLWPLVVVGVCAVVLVSLAAAYFLLRDDGDVAQTDATEPTPAVGLGSIAQPYDFGTGVVVFYDAGGQQRRWVVQILSPVADGTEEFTALPDGVAPVDGEVLAFSRVRVTYQSGPTPGQLDDLRLNAVGGSSTRYSQEQDRCAAATDLLVFDAQLEPSQSVEGNLCWEIAASDLGELKLAIEAGPADGTVHLSLN